MECIANVEQVLKLHVLINALCATDRPVPCHNSDLSVCLMLKIKRKNVATTGQSWTYYEHLKT